MNAPPGPLPQAYGRVTAPERFALLHTAAEALLDDLAAGYDVDRRDGAPSEVPAGAGAERVVVLIPPGGGAPLAVGFTPFPGLAVRYGRWTEDVYPSCGCDACDDDPQQLVDELTSRVESVVAGRFSEELGGRLRPRLTSTFLDPASDAGAALVVRLDRARALGPPARLRWPAWEPAGR